MPFETTEEHVRCVTKSTDFTLPYPEFYQIDTAAIAECEACGTKYCSSDCRNKALTSYHQSLCLLTKDEVVSHPLVE
ncbi:hypothetical protein TKK_0013169 [Trichogramma kaykai]|uniref:MYND-type domain-containing protein n=1 Tax=Trichogramma kaykai TaxID=54128 RepID=A0ABD2WJS9_9HYME